MDRVKYPLDRIRAPVVWTLKYERLVIGAEIQASESPQVAIRDSAGADADPWAGFRERYNERA